MTGRDSDDRAERHDTLQTSTATPPFYLSGSLCTINLRLFEMRSVLDTCFFTVDPDFYIQQYHS